MALDSGFIDIEEIYEREGERSDLKISKEGYSWGGGGGRGAHKHAKKRESLLDKAVFAEGWSLMMEVSLQALCCSTNKLAPGANSVGGLKGGGWCN